MHYSETLLAHFRQPVRAGSFTAAAPAQASARVGDPRRGGVMLLQLRIGPDGLIEQARFQAHGCGATIAAGSWVCDWLCGRTLAQAQALRDSQISAALGLPAGKLHCAVLASTAVRMAIADYFV